MFAGISVKFIYVHRYENMYGKTIIETHDLCNTALKFNLSMNIWEDYKFKVAAGKKLEHLRKL